jgi:hypothetical protein
MLSGGCTDPRSVAVLALLHRTDRYVSNAAIFAGFAGISLPPHPESRLNP